MRYVHREATRDMFAGTETIAETRWRAGDVRTCAKQKPGLRPHPENDVVHHRIFTGNLPRPKHRRQCRAGRVQNSLAQKCLSRYRQSLGSSGSY